MRRYEIERDDDGMPIRMVWLGDTCPKCGELMVPSHRIDPEDKNLVLKCAGCGWTKGEKQ